MRLTSTKYSFDANEIGHPFLIYPMPQPDWDYFHGAELSPEVPREILRWRMPQMDSQKWARESYVKRRRNVR